MSEVKITVDNFEEEVLKSDIPILVDFWATWCGPCQMLSPIIAELAEEYAGKIKVGKVNTDEEGALAQKFGIMSIPTVMFFRDGEVVETLVGFRPKDDFVKVING